MANPANDMYADTVTTVILEVQSNPKIQKGISLVHAYLTEEFLPLFFLHKAEREIMPSNRLQPPYCISLLYGT